MNRTINMIQQHQGHPMKQRKIYWSVKDQVCLIQCLELLGRYTFTDEDFVKVAQLMKDLHGIQRTPYQCSIKFKELKRFHPNPVVCNFFGKIKLYESVRRVGPQSPHPKLPCTPTAGNPEEGSSVHPKNVLKMEITLDDEDPPSSSVTPKAEQESVSFYIDTEGDSMDSDDDDEDIQVICETSGCSKAEEEEEEEEEESRVRQEAADTSGTRMCVKCKVSVAKDDYFCGNCGQSLQLTKCCECGCEVKLGTMFCVKCGAKQSKE